MHARLVAFAPLLISTVVVAGCSSTSGGAGGGGSGPGDGGNGAGDAPTIPADGYSGEGAFLYHYEVDNTDPLTPFLPNRTHVEPTSGSISIDANANLRVTVDGKEFFASAENRNVGEGGHFDYWGYNSDDDELLAELWVGQYLAYVHLIDDEDIFDSKDTYFDGIAGFVTEASNLPSAVATYEGSFQIRPNNYDGAGLGGFFDSSFDFDSGVWNAEFADIYDADMGEASGSITGNAFSGTLAAHGPGGAGTHYTGVVDGQFYGPDADEMGGLIIATTPNGEQAPGYMLGHR